MTSQPFVQGQAKQYERQVDRRWAELDGRPDVSTAAALLLGSQVRIPLRACMFVSGVCRLGSATEKKGIGLKYTQFCMLLYMGVKLGLALRAFENRQLRQTLGLRRT
jgi:hypothetical protein